MLKALQYIAIILLALVTAGCCINCRSWKIDKEITGRVLPASGTYHYYTNGLMKTETWYSSYYGSNVTHKVPDTKYKYCSNANGPWAGSEIYPATRFVLNGLSFMSYSSPASGDYMLNIVILPTYPIWLIELPIQFVLDTILLPWDLIAAPTVPEGYKLVY